MGLPGCHHGNGYTTCEQILVVIIAHSPKAIFYTNSSNHPNNKSCIVYRKNVERVREYLPEQPGLSTRKRLLILNVPKTSPNQVLHKGLHLHPYNMQILQGLKSSEPARVCSLLTKFWSGSRASITSFTLMRHIFISMATLTEKSLSTQGFTFTPYAIFKFYSNLGLVTLGRFRIFIHIFFSNGVPTC